MFSADCYVAALQFAAHRHGTQLVPGSELPYVVHLTSVAAEVIAALAAEPSIPRDADLAIQCALLHDTIEDTETTHAEVAAAFGTAVADGVQALTKDKHAAPDAMTDSLHRIRLQPHEIWLVKLADRTTNLAPPPKHWSRDKCRAYRAEGLAIVDALADASPYLAGRLRTRADAYTQFC